MQEYNVIQERWTHPNGYYLAAMDAIKNVIGKKQN